MRREIWRVLRRLKSAGQLILLIDKHVDALLHIADRHYILEKGRTVWQGSSSSELASNADVARLGV